MGINLGKNAKVSTAVTSAAGVAGTADINGSIIDMAGFDSVMAIVRMGVITANAVTSIKWQQDTDAAGGTMADLEGTAMTIADDDDDQIFVTELVKPQERYVRLVVDRGTANAVVASAEYIRYSARKAPVVQNVTDLVTYELNVSPAEGTA